MKRYLIGLLIMVSVDSAYGAAARKGGLLERVKNGAQNIVQQGKVALSTLRYNIKTKLARSDNAKQTAAFEHGKRLAKLEHKNYKDYFYENGQKVKEPTNENMLYAAENRHTNEMGLLIKAGANPNATDTQGKTALHYAALRGDKKTAKALLKYKCY